MTVNAGKVVYEVEGDTSKLVNASNSADAALDGLNKSMDKADGHATKLKTGMTKLASGVKDATKSMNEQSNSLNNLNKLIGAYLSYQTLKKAIAMSDQYGQMASRIKNATDSTAEYEMVQARLLETANGTYRALSEAQEVFLSTSDILKDLGYNTSEVLDITDSFSYALVRDAARADQATTAMDAYSKALMKGKIEADGWASIMAATPSIVEGIAAATGKTSEEIRKLGATSKLSVEALNEGLRRSREENKALAEEMETSVQDAFQKLTNSMTVFVGKVNESSGASKVLTEQVDLLSDVLQDPETIRAAQELAAGVVKALNLIIQGARDTVGMVKWMADSVAAALHGATSDDIVRLEDQLETYQKMLDNPLRRLRVGGKGQALAWFSEDEIKQNIDATQRMIDDFYKRNANPPKVNLPEPPKPTKGEEPLVDAVLGGSGKASTDSQKALDKLRQQAELAKLSGEAKAKLAAIQKLGAAATKEEREEAEKLAVEIYRLDQAEKSLKEGKKELAKDQKELTKHTKENTDAIQKLEEKVRLAKLSGEELGAVTAELELNEYATPEQIEQARKLGAELAKLEDIQSRRNKFGETNEDAKEHVFGTVTPLTGGRFDDQTARYEAEAAAEMKRYTDQQARLKEALEIEKITKQEYADWEMEMREANAQRMAQIETAKNETMMESAANAFGQMSSDLSAFANTFASENKAMFAIAKGTAIAQTIIETYAAAQKAFSSMASIPYVGPVLGAAAAAAAVAGGMARVAAIRSQSPGRQYGGPVAPGSMYRVNETGAPEVFNASNGQQYMIPNRRGEVVSNKDATRNGSEAPSNSVVVNQTINVVGEVSNRTASQIERETSRKQRQSVSRLG